MEDKMNREYFEAGATAFNYNNVTGGADSASGGSGGSGMECLQLRSPPGPFHYLISEQAKSLVALQELQNEVGALLEFRDLVIETFPNLRSKMAPSTPAGGARRDWEPGVRVRRKLAAGAGDARAKPQPSVQDSGFSTETSCGKDAHSSASASQTRSRPLEDELWALLDVIQRKGVRLRDEAEQLRGELDERQTDNVEDEFARALANSGCAECGDVGRLRAERDALLLRAAQLETAAAAAGAAGVGGATPGSPPRAPLGRLDAALDTPSRPPQVATPDSKKFAAILLESNPVELQRQLLTSTVQNQVLSECLRRAAAHRTLLLERLERARDINEDLKFRLEEKSIEVETTRAHLRQQQESEPAEAEAERAPAPGPARPRRSPARARPAHGSMRDMEPLHMPDSPDEDERIADTPRRRPSRIPLHTAHKGAAPRPPPPPQRPPSAHSAHSVRSARSAASGRSRASRERERERDRDASSAPAGGAARKERDAKSAVPVRRSPAAADAKRTGHSEDSYGSERFRDSLAAGASLAAQYVARAARLAPLFPRTRPLPADLALPYDLAYATPQNLALELSKSILYENADSVDATALRSLESRGDDSLWNGKPQQYFESMNYGERPQSDEDVGEPKEYDSDSLAP